MPNPYFDKSSNTGIRHFVNATRFTMRGLRFAFQRESAFRQELALGLLFFPAAFFIGQTPLEIALLIAVCLMVLVVELLNSAIEAVVDRISLEHSELSGIAKDLGSAAVALSLLMAFVVWVALTYQRFSV